MRTAPILQRDLTCPLLGFLTLHGCCHNSRCHVHSLVAVRPAQDRTKVWSLWHLSSPSPNLPFHSPLTHPLILHLGNAAGDSKYQDTAQALFHQGPQHLF